jgi:hypothetical protein
VAYISWRDGDVTWLDGDTVWLGPLSVIVADSNHAHSVDAVSITQVHTLVVADATNAHTVDVGKIGPHLIVADATHSQRTGTVTIVQQHSIVVADTSHSHSVDATTLVFCIIASEPTHGHSVDAVTVTQKHDIVLSDTTHAHSVESITTTQKQYLIPIDATHAITSDGEIEQYRNYRYTSVQADLVQQVKDIIQDTTYSYDDILDWLNEAQRLIAGGVLMVYPDRTQVFTSPLELLETTDTVTATSSEAYVSLPSDYSRELFDIYNETTGSFVNIDEAFGGMLNNSPVLGHERRVTDAVIEGNKLYYQGVPDDSQTLRLYYYRKPKEMATYTSTGISFSGTTISDSNSGLDVFYAGQTIDIPGNYTNSGEHVISSVESDGSAMTVTDSSTTEAAGRSITVASRPEMPEHLLEDTLVNRAMVKYLQRKFVFGGTVDLTSEYNAKFYRAMIDLETDRENVRTPKLWRAA